MGHFYNLRSTNTLFVCSSFLFLDLKENIPFFFLQKKKKNHIPCVLNCKFSSLCVCFPVYYSVVGGHSGTDTNVIPEQLLQTAYLLPANICASSPQFDGKYRTSAPFSAFSLILPFSLMFFFSPRDHLFPMFSRMLKLGMVYRRGR